MNAVSRIAAALLIALTALLGAVTASAQDATENNRDIYANWQALASRAEGVIDAEKASNAALEALREDIVGFRQLFTNASSENAERIRTLQSQIDALGPLPEKGEEEPDIATLRVTLNGQLSDLRVPVVVAQEAHSHASGLIAEIDRIIRQRQTRELLTRGPTPLNPAHWSEALGGLGAVWQDVTGEIRDQWNNPVEREQLRSNLPVVLLLGALGLVLLVAGRRWAGMLVDHLRSLGGYGSGVWSFVASLGRIALPYGGLVLLVQAISASGMAGLRTSLILADIPYWGAILLSYFWLGDRLYRATDAMPIVHVERGNFRKARNIVFALGVVLVLDKVLELIQQIENVSSSGQAALSFPLILLASLLLFQLCRVAVMHSPAGAEQPDAPPRGGLYRIWPLLRRAVIAVSLAAPLVAAVGYVNAAEFIIYPTILTLGLFALVLILHRLFFDLYAWLTGKGTEQARDALVPVLVGFALILAALPFLALIWGVRTADLFDLWGRFLDGFQMGDTRISPTSFLTFAIIFGLGYVITRMIKGSLKNNLLPKTRLDPGGQNAIVAGAGYVGIFLAAMIAFTAAGIDLSSLALVAGALSVGIGFGLQTIVSNFVSGIILLIERPISEGDWIEVGGQMGYVRDISVRSTRIETFDRSDVIIPNSDLVSGTVTNFTRGNTVGRVIVPVGVAYGTDTRRVETILREIAEAHPMILGNPAPSIVFQGFGADSLDFEIRGILRDVNWVLSVKSDLNHSIAERFTEEGIEIPFAQRDIWLRNPEALKGSGDNET